MGPPRRSGSRRQGQLTHFVATMGTTGTLMGCSKRFRELNPKIRRGGVEPYLGHRLQGSRTSKRLCAGHLRQLGARPQGEHRGRGGLGDDRALARKEGLLVAMSGGAAMHVAYELAQQNRLGPHPCCSSPTAESATSRPPLFAVQTGRAAARLHFFTRVSRQHEPFEPLSDGEVKTLLLRPRCTPPAHLGVLRRMLVDDLVRRALEHAGHKVKHVVSITDMDDFTIRESERTGEPLLDLCPAARG